MNVIVGELEDGQKASALPPCEIVTAEAEIDVEPDQEEDMVVTISHGSYLKRTPAGEYRAQHAAARQDQDGLRTRTG
ncbi:MAG: hypothetical protein U0271_10355 [Polyangiaceae bacterium]